jgi:hypothetical protein
MRVLLVDPFYLAGHSPPSWVLGRLEASLEEQDHSVVLSDFCPGRVFANLAEFRKSEWQFIDRTARLAGGCDAVLITTSFGVPQKPTPILGRVEALVGAIAEHAPGIPLVIGGAQIEYLMTESVDPATLIEAGPVTAFVRSEEAMLAALSPALSNSRSSPPGLCAWRAWDPAKYPPYRAVLTSSGCRYACSFCFESKQQFRPFDLAATLHHFADATPLLVIEDSTILGAHGLSAIESALERLRSPIEFTCYALVSEVDRVGEEDLRRLRQYGMTSVILGIETPDSGALRLYRKNVQPDRVRRALGKLHEAGISTQGCLMLGIPEVSLTDTLYTLEYALDLDIDVRRWHVFQPSFVRQPERLSTPQPLSIDRFAKVTVNLPDNLLPELFADADPETFLEEHFLVRAIPYVKEVPDRLETFHYQAGYTLKSLYERMLSTLRGTKDSFNEEDYYRVLTPDHLMYPAVVDCRTIS